MHHLPLLLGALVVIGAGILALTAGRDEDDQDDRPSSAPGGAPSPAEPDVLASPPESLRPDGTPVDLSRRFATFSVRDVTLAEALEEVARLLECEVSLSAEARRRVDASRLTLELADVGAPTVLNLLTEPYGLVYRVHRGVLWILMPGEAPPEAGG